jgi:16S rRNA (adenine1518-N6/adenine1519-N6)-dimethyltransferase
MSNSFQKKKSLGQNFLKNKGVLREMVSAASLTEGETVLEIGPGKGALTQELLSAGSRVIAIEKDRRLIPILEETFAEAISEKRLILLEGDILELFPNIPELSDAPFKVVANIPYYISGALLRLFLQSDRQPTTMVLMMQREVVKRIVARDEKESILSLSVKVYGAPTYVATVKKELFSPKPKVDSAILAISGISKTFFSDTNEQDFFLLIKTTFGQKRKTLGHTLKPIFKDKTASLFAQTAIDPKTRPEDLALLDWKRLLSEWNPN